MKLETWTFDAAAGWSKPLDAQWDSKQTVGFVFGAYSYLANAKPLQELSAMLPNSHLVGCSTSGEIHQARVADDSLSVAVVRFEKTEIASVAVPIVRAEDSFSVGQQIAQGLRRDSLKSIFILSVGLGVNGSELIKGVNSQIPENVTVTGGLAGDGGRFKETWTLHNGAPQTGQIVAVGFYGDAVNVGHGSKGGWDVFGPERKVTRSSGNVLYELDGKPALQLYKQYLGDRASELPASGLLFPLSIRSSETDSKYLVRTILGIDEASQSLTFAGDVPQGSLGQLMKANFDRLIDAAGEAAKTIPPACSINGSILCIAISCVGRRLILGQRTEEEVEASLDALPPSARQIGYYSYGELSPFGTGTCDLHNQTMTLTTFCEAA